MPARGMQATALDIIWPVHDFATDFHLTRIVDLAEDIRRTVCNSHGLAFVLLQ